MTPDTLVAPGETLNDDPRNVARQKVAYLPGFVDSDVWPYDVELTSGATLRVNAASPDAATDQLLRSGYRPADIASVTTAVVTRSMMSAYFV